MVADRFSINGLALSDARQVWDGLRIGVITGRLDFSRGKVVGAKGRTGTPSRRPVVTCCEGMTVNERC
jgi:hypothetical protein